MAFTIPQAGLQLEDYDDVPDYLPSQAFVLDLSDEVIDGIIESANQGQEIRLALGNTPTIIYGNNSHHIEPANEDGNDDLELFLTDTATSTFMAERLPQFGMSLFRKPEMGNPWEEYRGSSEDEEDEYDEEANSPESDDGIDQQSYDDEAGIANLRSSLAQLEAEKMEKSAKVIEGNLPPPTSKNAKQTAMALQKALSGKRSPFNRASLSPLPGSPAISAGNSPSLLPADVPAQQATEQAKQARSPIIHELAFKRQPYDDLWQKYPFSESEFKSALDKVAEIEPGTPNYTLRVKYWKELDVWSHEYTSDERQQAIDNAVRQYDKMRLSPSDPEWDRLLPREERGKGRILSKIYSTIAKGPQRPPKAKTGKSDESSGEAGSREDSGDNSNGSVRTDEDGAESEGASASSSRPATAASGASTGKKKVTAQEKRLLSNNKKKNTPAPTSAPSSTKVSPAKPSARAGGGGGAKQTKYKSKELITDSDTSDSETESVPLSTTVPQSKLATANTKPTAPAKTPAAKPPLASSADRPRKAAAASATTTTASTTAAEARKTKPAASKNGTKAQAATLLLSRKRVRDEDDDSGCSSSSSSGTPLAAKRNKLADSTPKMMLAKEREKSQQLRQQSASQALPPAANRMPNISPDSSSSSGSGSGSYRSNGSSDERVRPSSQTNGNNANLPLSGSKNNVNSKSPTKSSPLGSSPPTNASELDVSSEESVPPIGTSNTNQKRRMVEERRKNYMGADSSSSGSDRQKKRRQLPSDVLEQARKFKRYYEKYEALYKDIASRSNPPKEKVSNLLEMHHRLQEMKKNIYNDAMGRS